MTQNEIKAVKDLVVCSFYGRTPDPTKYGVEDVQGALKDAIHTLACDWNTFQRNKLDLFEIVQQAYDEVFPKQVEQFIGAFAEIKHVPLGQKAVFKVRTGRRRAHEFITEVGLSGVYEAFRLDSNTFEVGGRAIGGTAIIDFERYLIGEESIAEATEILLEGLQLALYGQIQKALIASVNAAGRPAANRVVTAGFDAKEMERLCRIAASYGSGSAVIYATPEFVAEMGPDAIGMPVVWPAGSAGIGVATPVYNPRNIDEIAQYGRIKTFRGNTIIEIPQSYTDERNEVTQMNPALAYIFPSGRGEKPVKVVFEGNTQLDEFKNRDRSFEVEVYQRVGVAIITNHDWCVYVNADLQDQEVYPTKYPSSYEVNP